MKRFILAFVAAYIFIFLWGWLLNGDLKKLGVGRCALGVRRSLDELTDSSRARLSDAGGMGTACSHVAFVAAARGDQFPRFIRSGHASVARNGRSADRIRTGLH